MLCHEPGQDRKVAALSVQGMCDGTFFTHKGGNLTMDDRDWM